MEKSCGSSAASLPKKPSILPHPVTFAKKVGRCRRRLAAHLDLDAAFSGEPKNLAAIEKICAAVNVPCELGGGMRNFKNVSVAFSAGVSRVILGTRACESPDYIAEMCKEFGGDPIAVGIDAKAGCVAVKGWTESPPRVHPARAYGSKRRGPGTTNSYNDIATDGMLEGPNYAELEKILSLLDCQLIASGGVSSADDLRRLAAMSGLHGAIIGKALLTMVKSLATCARFWDKRTSMSFNFWGGIAQLVERC